MKKTEREMYELIVKIAAEDERIRAAYMHGSRADPNAVTDIYSDYDIVFVVTETDPFIKNRDWLNAFGDVVIIVEGLKNENMFFGKELNDLARFYVWSLLLKDGSRIDILAEIEEEAMKSKFTANRRTVVLLDKDGCLPETRGSEAFAAEKPTEDKYTACCSGFWWFLSDAAKYIARDQLPCAMAVFNSLIRLTLNQMVDWHIGMKTNFSVSTGKNGQFFKKYLSEEFYGLYEKTYADGVNFWNSIFAACDLFGKSAQEVGGYFGFVYNKQNEETMRKYLDKMKADTLGKA